MEIQTIQSAVAGIHRINEFFGLEEKENGAQENGDTEKTWNNPATKIEENRNEKISRKEADVYKRQIPVAFRFRRCTRRREGSMCMLQTQKIQCLER